MQNIFDVAVLATGLADNFIDILLANNLQSTDIVVGENLAIPNSLPINNNVVAYLSASAPVTIVNNPGIVPTTAGAAYTIKNTLDEVLFAGIVASAGVLNLIIPDLRVVLNGSTIADQPATKNLSLRLIDHNGDLISYTLVGQYIRIDLSAYY